MEERERVEAERSGRKRMRGIIEGRKGGRKDVLVEYSVC